VAELGDVILSVIIKVNAPTAVGSSALLGGDVVSKVIEQIGKPTLACVAAELSGRNNKMASLGEVFIPGLWLRTGPKGRIG
jgi:hypothetical protein